MVRRRDAIVVEHTDQRVGEVAHLARRRCRSSGRRTLPAAGTTRYEKSATSPGRAGGSGIPNRSGTASIIDSPVTVPSSARPNNRVERYSLAPSVNPCCRSPIPTLLGANRAAGHRTMPSVRVIIFGAGAVGSVIGGRLRQSGADVALVARPAHARPSDERGLDAAHGEGKRGRRHRRRHVDRPARADRRRHRDRSPPRRRTPRRSTPSCSTGTRTSPSCAAPTASSTNALALRRFARVYGMVIQLPAQFEKPGEVTVLCGPTNAILDVGRYPAGVDETATRLAALIDSSPRLLSEADDDVMTKKYGKLLVNLGNVADAACGIAGRGARVVAAGDRGRQARRTRRRASAGSSRRAGRALQGARRGDAIRLPRRATRSSAARRGRA